MDDEREDMSDEAQATGASEDGEGAPAEASTGADSQVDTDAEDATASTNNDEVDGEADAQANEGEGASPNDAEGDEESLEEDAEEDPEQGDASEEDDVETSAEIEATDEEADKPEPSEAETDEKTGDAEAAAETDAGAEDVAAPDNSDKEDGETEANPADSTDEGDAEAQSSDDASDTEPETPAADDPGATTILDHARTLGAAGSRTVGEGISAMRELARARRALAKARTRLAELERTAKDQDDELSHRREVEGSYDEIVRVQTDELADASALLASAGERLKDLADQRDANKAELKRLKAENDRRIAPYRELRDSAKGTLEDTEHARAEAARALKLAQAQADDATNARDTRLSSANRAADNAANRLARLQDQLTKLKRDPSAGAKEISEMSSGVAGALAQLQNAREDVARVTQETTKAVEIAQTHLYTQKKSLEEAEADLEAARDDEREKREEHARLRQEADDAERELADKGSDLERQIKEERSAKDLAQGRIDAAQALIDEAEDIHAHPEATEELEQTLAETRTAAEDARQQADVLVDEERDVRERTMRARRTFYSIVAAVVVVVAVILWMTLGR